MASISIREYAQNKGISYQAVSKSIHKYQKELEGHISKQNGKQWLDDEAQRILDDKRRVNPIVIVEEASAEAIEQLKEELKLKDALIIELQQKLINLHEEQVSLIEYKAKNEMLLEDSKLLKEKVEELNQEKKKAEEEAGSYQKTFFGFYRKKN